MAIFHLIPIKCLIQCERINLIFRQIREAHVAAEYSRGEQKAGSRSEPNRNKNDLTYETGKEKGILANKVCIN